jgi:hypothetical protein
MSATTLCLAARRSAFLGFPAAPAPALLFSTLMRDDARSIARGLHKRDPDLLDRLIEQYQYRLFRGFFSGNMDPRDRARPPVRRKIEI